VLELWLGRCECDRKLAEELRVGVQRVAGLVPLLVGNGRPPGGHRFTLAIEQCLIRPVAQVDRQPSRAQPGRDRLRESHFADGSAPMLWQSGVPIRSKFFDGQNVTITTLDREEPVLQHRLFKSLRGGGGI
jgi:hypothetical protein